MLAAALLTPVALVYEGVIRARNLYYHRVPGAVRRAGVPVISVGNLTVGGTGKTPLVIEIVRRLREWGRRPAILTRGYRGTAEQEADEVREYRDALPDVSIVVDPDRVAGARTAVAMGADCLVLDDGFQHRRLARDLDIVLIDALNPWGRGQMLPAGRLREPKPSLRRAHLFVLTRANQADPAVVESLHLELERLAAGRTVVTAEVIPASLHFSDGRDTEVGALRGRETVGVCGLGNPVTFEQLLGTLTKRPVITVRYPDHRRYDLRDAERIALAADGGRWVVTTRKDWVKLHPLWPADGPPLVRLDVRMTLADGAATFEDRLRRALEHP
jgi:tetraacyldisaccharide 4'-kinase